jgi:hypothetical protein
MADGDLSDFAEQARQRSEAFMQRSREQMFQNVQMPSQGMGGRAAPGIAGGFAAGEDRPMPGTPAGRLLDTITDLVRRGTTFGVGAGGAAVGGFAQPIAGGYGAATQAAGGGLAFLAGAGAFGPAGTGGGTQLDLQQRMNFFQSAFTAYGSGLPFGLGRYAAQRTDMERLQAQVMAREDMAYSMAGGAQRGLFGALNLASFGLSNFMMRREGMLLETTRSQEFSRRLQGQLRFLTRDALEEAGLGEYAGVFAAGVSRRGAEAFAAPMMRQLGRLEREMGLDPSEVMALQGRAMGMMGVMGVERAVRAGGAGELGRQVGRQTFAVRDIQQTLNLSEDEAEEFFQTIGQMYGTAERVAGMARQARQAAGRWGMSKREVFDIMREFEDVGRGMALGQTRAREAGMDLVGAMRAQQRAGLLTREELLMYGGRTEEEALRIQARTRFQAGVGLYQQGALQGLGMMMTQNRPAYMQFLTGGMGAMDVRAAVGQTLARDPWAGLTAQYDPRTTAMAGRLGWMTQYQMVVAEERGGFFLSQNESERIRRFQDLTGMQNLEAARWYRVYEREQNRFREMARNDLGARDPDQAALEIQGIYHRMLGEGMGEFAETVTGRRDPYAAATRLWQLAGGGTDRFDPNARLEDVLLGSAQRTISPEFTERIGRILGRSDHMDPYYIRAVDLARGIGDDEEAIRIRFRGATHFFQNRLDITGAIESLGVRGASETMLTEMFLGGPGRAPGIFGGREGEHVRVQITPQGRVRVTHSSLGGGPREVSLQELPSTIESLNLPEGVRSRVLTNIYERLTGRMRWLRRGGLQETLQGAVERGDISVMAQAAYERLIMGRHRGLAENLFPGIEMDGIEDRTLTAFGAPETMRDLVGRTANLEVIEKSYPSEFRRIQEYLRGQGLEGVLGFTRAFHGRSGGGLAVQDWGRLSTLFGTTSNTAASLRAAVETAGIDIDGLNIEQALKGAGQARSRLEKILSMSPVATQIFNQVVGNQEREVNQIRDGSSPEKAFWVVIKKEEKP